MVCVAKERQTHAGASAAGAEERVLQAEKIRSSGSAGGGRRAKTRGGGG